MHCCMCAYLSHFWSGCSGVETRVLGPLTELRVWHAVLLRYGPVGGTSGFVNVSTIIE